MKLTESEVKELVKAALREAFINEGFMIKENVNNDWWTSVAYYRGDVILDSDENYAVVYNNSVGGTYNIMLKITSEELSDAIQNASEQDLYYASEDVKNFIKQNGGE